jgi:hypothetical protein
MKRRVTVLFALLALAAAVPASAAPERLPLLEGYFVVPELIG